MEAYLFPSRFKNISGLIFYLTNMIGVVVYFSGVSLDELLVIKVPAIINEPIFTNNKGIWIENGILDELITVVLIISGIIHSFSREKMEDEYISSIRLQALTWSIYVNYSLVILATLLIFEMAYFHVMVIHLFSLIFLFNLRFQLKLRAYYKSATDEE
ncbi:MAG: hypothetical protein RLZZ417_1268 [Bacteroidota bacterium]|jgi:hypothetical protein